MSGNLYNLNVVSYEIVHSRIAISLRNGTIGRIVVSDLCRWPP
jgi:hypothetical protein